MVTKRSSGSWRDAYANIVVGFEVQGNDCAIIVGGPLKGSR